MPILIINQDDFFLQELQNAFEANGYQVVTTTNSLLAEQLFFQHKPRAVILDVCMPNKDGFEITQQIRKVCKKTFILAVSINPLYLRMIKKLGATEVFPYLTESSKIVSAVRCQA